MSVTRVGATKQYSDNWDNIFGGKGRSSAKTKSTAPARQSAKKKTPKQRRSQKTAKKPSGRK